MFTNLVSNARAKLISASLAVKKHRGFSVTDEKKSQDITENFGKVTLL